MSAAVDGSAVAAVGAVAEEVSWHPGESSVAAVVAALEAAGAAVAGVFLHPGESLAAAVVAELVGAEVAERAACVRTTA